MTCPNPSSTNNPPTPLTPTQARALLNALVASRTQQPSSSASTPKPPSPPRHTAPAGQSGQSGSTIAAKKQMHHSQRPQQIINIDASTQIMGHCNNVQLAAIPSATEQAAKIVEMLEGKLKGGAGGFNVSVQTGVRVTGSRNVVVLGRGRKGPGGGSGGDAVAGVGAKRKADEVLEAGVSVKKERVEDGCDGLAKGGTEH